MSARGAPGFPDLTDGEWMWGSDFVAIKTTLTGGRQAAMAPWGAALGGDQGIAAMTQYVLSLSGAEHDAAVAATAAPQFQAFCVACHGPEGKGNALFGAPDLTNDVWLYGGTAEHIATTLAAGRTGQMPAFAPILSPEKIHILAGYVSGLGKR
jgi:cytochrome c oxidase cbb3-type subunit 3